MSLRFVYISFILIFGLLLSGIRMYKYILSVRQANLEIVFEKIKNWYGLISSKGSEVAIAQEEKFIEELFEKKIIKTSLLHFDIKFIEKFLESENRHIEGTNISDEFEKISRINLEKSKKSLKLISMAVGHNFSQENYSFLNFWLILKGNRVLYKTGRPDTQGRSYTFSDIEEPFRVLEFYFYELKNKGKK